MDALIFEITRPICIIIFELESSFIEEAVRVKPRECRHYLILRKYEENDQIDRGDSIFNL